MINKSVSGLQIDQKSSTLPIIIHTVLHYKYSQEIIQHFERRTFQQFMKPTHHHESHSHQQIKGKDFITFYSFGQHLLQYNDLPKTISKIRTIILTRINSDYVQPLHFHDNYLNFFLRYIQSHPKFIAMKGQRPPSSYPYLTEQLFLNQAKNQSSKKQSITVCTPKEKPRKKGSAFHQQIGLNTESVLQEGSTNFLQKINRDLSLLIRRINDPKESIDITECLQRVKATIKVKTQINLIKKQHNKLNNLEEKAAQNQENDFELYGLNKLKRTISVERKQRNLMGVSQARANKSKRKQQAQTPKSQFKRKKLRESPKPKEQATIKKQKRKDNISLKTNKAKLKSSKLQLRK